MRTIFQRGNVNQSQIIETNRSLINSGHYEYGGRIQGSGEKLIRMKITTPNPNDNKKVNLALGPHGLQG